MPTLNQLLEAGAHFGHKRERSFPRAKQFTYTIRDSVYVIDLEKTIEQLDISLEFLKKAVGSGKTILFVGTKGQAKEAVKKTATSLNMPFIVQKWLGGTLTNFETINKSLKKLNELEELIKSEDFNKYTKKERKRIEEKRIKLEAIFEGMKNLSKLPDILFVVDTAKENVAVLEARRMEIPIVGLCDTNANPDLISYPIPANDDSKKTIELILAKVVEELKGIKVQIPQAEEVVEKSAPAEKPAPKVKATVKKPTKKSNKE